MDKYGEVKPENINWDKPFNELSTQEQLLTEESHKNLENFFQFHATHQEFQEESKKYWEILEQQVILVPDAMSQLSKENWGKWMMKDEYTGQIVFDHRNNDQKAL